MNPAPIPGSDRERVDALRRLKVLDTPAEERFDRLTRLAKKLFDVPIALVSLVDENRQWFKSKDGLDAPETPRDISFCGHAIYEDDLLVINDARLDERFCDNPLVVGGPNIRFYAGYPLRDQDGHALGTLCLIDRQPRTLDEFDLESLQDLAIMAENELIATKMATVDDLTGLSNRRGFVMLAEKSLNLAERHQHPLSLLFFDLNKFKPINDEFGHAEGDRVLINFAEILKREFRRSDIFARLGGDEFVVLLSDTNKAGAQAGVEKLSRVVAKYNRTSGKPYEIAFSAGVVEYSRFRHDSLDALLADGDEMMYAVKKEGQVSR
jgi:diguanylate cyclase (GGDEF)-like protein